MSDEVLADPRSLVTTTDEPSTDAGPADVRIAAAMVAGAGQIFETLTSLAAPRRETLSAAERLLAELDATWAARE